LFQDPGQIPGVGGDLVRVADARRVHQDDRSLPGILDQRHQARPEIAFEGPGVAVVLLEHEPIAGHEPEPGCEARHPPAPPRLAGCRLEQGRRHTRDSDR
jgi:hypothetical protein